MLSYIFCLLLFSFILIFYFIFPFTATIRMLRIKACKRMRKIFDVIFSTQKQRLTRWESAYCFCVHRQVRFSLERNMLSMNKFLYSACWNKGRKKAKDLILSRSGDTRLCTIYFFAFHSKVINGGTVEQLTQKESHNINGDECEKNYFVFSCDVKNSALGFPQLKILSKGIKF